MTHQFDCWFNERLDPCPSIAAEVAAWG